MTPDQIRKAVSKIIGEAMENRMDFDIWWMTRKDSLICLHCHKTYKAEGWLYNHYAKTGHWKGGAP